ncbi:hypothetical protein LC048_16160 [Mesobacillus subterraneus]|uniref:hypothetical protein n=1 Tax=Mesobacillus subterraneus TaxID=285983 RepID=UPI002740145C|nr:hypothetical protein [Mesobacillus subterraneus]WLR54018.1 hypothetical protein LC048_16160 [Mesobacillus subterraneus]
MDKENARRNIINRLPRTPAIRVASAIVWPFIGFLIDLVLDIFPFVTVLGFVGGSSLYFLLTARSKKTQKETGKA